MGSRRRDRLEALAFALLPLGAASILRRFLLAQRLEAAAQRIRMGVSGRLRGSCQCGRETDQAQSEQRAGQAETHG
jgi:hypothetical protein